ncbi:MAG: type II methionyl aminopeptidase [Candidatus Thorarchaeota archaeon]|nr:type II methionyl aminopeptidase [Candidatus Thorarchaeota archaeon]
MQLLKPHPDAVKAGEIAARVLKETRKMVEPNTKIIRLCVHAEKRIVEYGGKPAFPFNVCINNIAAHRTSPRNDSEIIPEFGLVKLDVGVHVNGYIADTGLTVDIDGSLEGFPAATDDALQEAFALFKPGMSLSKVGKQIERTIGAYGLRPVKDLSGHSIARFKLHAGKKVPNIGMRNLPTIEAGEYYAIEPYATSGSGRVVETDHIFIFANRGKAEPLEGTTEKLRLYLREKYGSLPFAIRWVKSSSAKVNLVDEFRELLKNRAIRPIPMLVEKSTRPVSMSEHTIFVSKDGPVILTKVS